MWVRNVRVEFIDVFSIIKLMHLFIIFVTIIITLNLYIYLDLHMFLLLLTVSMRIFNIIDYLC